MQKWENTSADEPLLHTAIQRLPVRLLSDRGPIRAHGQLAHSDEPGEQGGFSKYLT